MIAEVAALTAAPNPPGRVFLGQAGIGKTHLVGVMKRRAWAAGCWFVMLDVVGITDFWKSAALSFVTSLLQEMPDGQKQYQAVITGIARRFRIEKEVNIAFDSPAVEPKRLVDLLVGGLMKTSMANALRHQDVFRALALLRSHDIATVGIAHAWLQGYDADEAMRRALGFLSPPPSPVQIVEGLLWVMGLAGPTLIAVDQVDGVISMPTAGPSDFGETSDFTALLSGGLLDLARKTGRGMLVMTCLLSSWEVLKSRGPSPLSQSFTPPVPLRPARNVAFVRKLIADRLLPAYAKAGIQPETPTGPFSQAAIVSASQGMTPRSILMRCDEHRRLCLSEGRVLLCNDLADSGGTPTKPPGETGSLDADFKELVSSAELAGLIDEKDDTLLGALLREAFDLYAKQIPSNNAHDVLSQSDSVQRTPPLHGRLTFIDHEANDRARHYCFRALQHSNAVALCARFRAALTASGIAAKVADRKLVVVRRGPPPSGPKTRELFEAFRAAGGIEIDPSDADLRSFVALRQMRDAALAGSAFDAFERWLIARKPLCETEFFKAAGLCPPPLPPWDETAAKGQAPDPREAASKPIVTPERAETTPAAPSAVQTPPPPPPTTPPVTETQADIPIGPRVQGGSLGPLQVLPLKNLVRHTAIFAGSGSGKTVLLRRIVEEAALAGIPAIVLDTNNDLARLGVPWPSRPEAFSDADEAKAKRYAETVEVAVWTPGVPGGRPLTLAVLPDFSALAADDEVAQAVDMAWATLAPLVGARGATKDLKEGVLKEALTAFARERRTGIDAFIDYLAELPVEVSRQSKAQKFGLEMSDQLRAKIAVNPLLNAAGQPLDPAVLFTASRPGATRISVVNFAGLAADASKQDFVNQLQMALFTWIKRHPSATPRLYVCDEAQNFAPSQGSTASKASAVALAQQGRKFGLGMIFATQAPKGIDTNIVSNCLTHFYGRMSSPALLDATEDMIKSRGGTARDLGALTFGLFYFSTEGTPAPVKVKTPLCLSYHPANPATPEEVEALARG
ncbi:AAA family ATPase [Beijerinckiaceae bacterium RH AL1]|nr:ATP-binding protein [Beijerinckiaceae bacterium]VVB48317.1 AAA family ATPase [Beijerinckiaceae bacterium RH CH11]VVB48398.1 AAA family ATPase [Beijerinckiaceae bacterium RH AL8]VVC56333.1 AAA family ATPase [Beijerinckiaceae bacterium RH AL1]